MEINDRASEIFGRMVSYTRHCIFRILSRGPIPSHLAFIMDGNRRFAKKKKLETGSGHRAGVSALMSLLQYCYELGVKCVSVYAFSIDNFKRRPDEVQVIMDLMLEKTEGLLKEESLIHQYGIRVYFIGNLKLLNESVRVAAQKVMKATANNTKCVLLICVAYTSSNEMTHAVQESCKDKWSNIEPFKSGKVAKGVMKEVEFSRQIDNGIQESCKDETDKFNAVNASLDCNNISERTEGIANGHSVTVNPIQERFGDKWVEGQALDETRTLNSEDTYEECKKIQSHSIIKLVDVEKHMYMAVAPDPDVLIRTAGGTRLSNFLLWQSSKTLLYSPHALWPDIGLWHLVWTVLNFQRNYSYLEKKKKQP